ncbi:unannotated protein [freshwater metagenome]|uniref:Unannotated protein n=1 Tax=freshwater metagenome TaxID=449393 RepID=A0A6J6Z608_9ZZZZ|nr:molybdopterin-synthase adenylyltransferase MoeB [Actinomycetota bacterium]
MEIPPLIEQGSTLSAEEARRYSRHLALPDISTIGQERLKKSKVLCVGAGGLGSPVLMYLAAAGIGTLGIVDFDVVDESNLQRQILHGESDIGKSKAASARATILEINSHVNVVVHDVELSNRNALEILGQYDLIIDGTDNFATRYLINDSAVLLGKPYVWGSIYRFDGQATVFWAEHGPCYRCLHPQPAVDVASCAEAGVLGVLCATIGAIQATEAIKIITGAGTALIGNLMMYNALDMSFEKIEIKKDPLCDLCSQNASQHQLLDDYEAFCTSPSSDEISVFELKERMQQGKDFLLVDVREAHEFELVRIPGSILIPMSKFFDGSAIASLPMKKEIILYCKVGIRSATALNILKSAGHNRASHVSGGVLAWVENIEPELKVY